MARKKALTLDEASELSQTINKDIWLGRRVVSYIHAEGDFHDVVIFGRGGQTLASIRYMDDIEDQIAWVRKQLEGR
jgi:hypothetical protein